MKTTEQALPVGRSGATAIDVARRCVREAGTLARARFGERQPTQTKGRGNVVTPTDVEVEHLVHGILRAEYPDTAILSEETAAGTDPEKGWVWVLDPIDGTKNYSLGIPFWCVTMALLHEGEPQAGVTWDPLRDDWFEAIVGEGATLNGKPIATSTSPNVDSSVLGMDLGYEDDKGSQQLALMGRIFPRVQTMRILGSAALAFAYAACGRLDMFTHTNVSAWDIAAGMLLVREAGGIAVNRDGGPLRITGTRFATGGRAVVEDFMRRYINVDAPKGTSQA